MLLSKTRGKSNICLTTAWREFTNPCFLACFPRAFFQFFGRVKKAQGTAFFTVSLLSWAFHRLCEPKVKVVQPVSRGPGFSATDARVSPASVVSVASRQRSFRISGKLLIFLGESFGEDMLVSEIGIFESRCLSWSSINLHHIGCHPPFDLFCSFSTTTKEICLW